MHNTGGSGSTKEHKINLPQVNTMALMQIIRKVDSSHYLELAKWIYDKTPKRCFFERLLNDLCETIEKDEYNDEILQILDLFCMKDEKDTGIRTPKLANKSKKLFNYVVDASAVIKKILKSKCLHVDSKNRQIKDFGAQDIVGKLFTLMQELGSTKYWWKYGDVYPSEFLTFRIRYKKGELPTKNTKDKDLEKIRK